MIEMLVIFVIGTVLSAVCLWAGMKITNVDGSFVAMLIVAAVSTGLGFLPLVGWIVGTVAMFVLICTLTDAEFWPDAILMVFVAKLMSLGLGGLLGALLFAG